jgi:hypothetical protein
VGYEQHENYGVILSRLVGYWILVFRLLSKNKINYTIVESIDLGLEKRIYFV